MYQGRLYSDHVQRVDVDIKLPSGEIISAFDLKLTFWHLEDALNFYLHNPEDGRNPEVQRDLAIFLEKDVLPVFRKSGYPSPREINIRYRSWKPFTLETRDRPQTDLIVFHYIVPPDRMGLR